MYKQYTHVRTFMTTKYYNTHTYTFMYTYHDMTVAVYTLRPQLRPVFPDLRVLVQAHGEVILDEVLGRHAEVEGIPMYVYNEIDIVRHV